MTLRTEGRWFKDDAGRTLHLRGVNLGGSSKVPTTPDGATWRREGFYDHRNVSFIGRPFPLSEADEHFRRLKAWGLTFLRLLTPWEAIEHAGPGQYDMAYLDYLEAVVRKAAEYGMLIYIDPHQDVWSRWTGGDGAPGWTLEAVGMDPRMFQVTGAAITHQETGKLVSSKFWASNANRFACATMWTLFFGGDLFAPATQVEGEPVQSYLQGHYIGAMQQVARRLRNCPNVLGYDTLNEPLPGYIGVADMHAHVSWLIASGPTPTPWQGMLLASGFAQEVADHNDLPIRLGKVKTVRIDPKGATVWLPSRAPIWRENGVWEVGADGAPRLLRPEHFHTVGERQVAFYQDCYHPFIRRYAEAIRAEDPDAMLFVEPVPPQFRSGLGAAYAPEGLAGTIHAPHWYDGVTLGLRRYLPWLAADTEDGEPHVAFGYQARMRSLIRQVQKAAARSETAFVNTPFVIGETGIAYALDGGAAYRSGDFRRQVWAMDDTMRALEANLANFTLWNYCADNDAVHGDQWNDEDCSIFSRQQQTGSGELYDGGRALDAVVRPYPIATPGEPVRWQFDLRRRRFTFSFRRDPLVDAPLVLFVPWLHYRHGYCIDANVEMRIESLADQKLMLSLAPDAGEVEILLYPCPPKSRTLSVREGQTAEAAREVKVEGIHR